MITYKKRNIRYIEKCANGNTTGCTLIGNDSTVNLYLNPIYKNLISPNIGNHNVH